MSLTLENLSRVVDGVDYIREANLTFEAGSFNVLLGRTLAGKTSLMRLMAGLDKPSSGRLIFNGEDVTGEFFDFSQGEVQTAREFMPSMLTLDRRVIQQDCLCYLMERIHFEDNEEVTTVDPLPEGIERSDYVW